MKERSRTETNFCRPNEPSCASSQKYCAPHTSTRTASCQILFSMRQTRLPAVGVRCAYVTRMEPSFDATREQDIVNHSRASATTSSGSTSSGSTSSGSTSSGSRLWINSRVKGKGESRVHSHSCSTVGDGCLAVSSIREIHTCTTNARLVRVNVEGHEKAIIKQQQTSNS